MSLRRYKIYEYPDGFVPVRGFGLGPIFVRTAFLCHRAPYDSVWSSERDLPLAETLDAAKGWLTKALCEQRRSNAAIVRRGPTATYTVITRLD